MIEIICVNPYPGFIVGNNYYAQGETTINYDRYDSEEFYIFYGEYCYTRDMWEENHVSKYYFLTPAEYRENRINEIFND